MKIRRIQIDGFGHFRHFELTLAPGLNVLHGPNEAGKSTLLAFVRAVLFGFERRTGSLRYEPETGPFGGELLLDSAFGPLTVRRLGSKRRFDGELQLRDAKGELLPESKLAAALGGTSRELFFKVFAFGLDALSSFEELASQGSVSEAIFAAGMLGAQRLPNVLEGLRRESEALFAPRGSKKELNVLLNELQELQLQLRELGDRPSHYQKQAAELPRLEAELDKLEARLDSSQRRMDQLERLCSAAVDLARFEVVRAELESIGDLKDFPEGGLERLEQLTGALARGRAERDEVLAEAASVERLLAELAAEEGRKLDAPRLKAAVDAFATRLHQFRGLPAKKATLAGRRRQVDAALKGLGLPLEGSKLVGMELGAAARMKLSSLRDQLLEARATLAQRTSSVSAARATRDAVEQDIRRLTTDVARLPSWPLEAVRRRQSALRRIEPLRAESAAFSETSAQRRVAADAQHAQAAADGVGKAFLPWPLALLVCSLLVGLASAVFLLRGARDGQSAAVAAVVLSGGVLFLERRSARSHRSAVNAHRQRQAAHQKEAQRLFLEAELLDHKVRERHAELQSCAAELSLPLEADASALLEREDQLEQEMNEVRLRQKLAVESEALTPKLVSARTNEKNAEVDRNVAEARVSVLERLVEELYASIHFPPKLPVERALELWTEVAGLRQRLLDVRSEEEGLNEEDRECLAAARSVLDAAQEAGLSSSGPEDALSGLSDTLTRVGEQARERKALVQRREDLKVRRVKCERSCIELETALSRLLTQARAKDEELFRKRAAAAQEFRRATAEARELSVRIETSCGRGVQDVQAELRVLGGRDGALRELASLRTRVNALVEDRKRLVEERGGLKKQLAIWETDTEIGRLRQREELLAARAGELAQRYAVDRLALQLLGRARETFEREQQPRVVKLASALFAELTAGKYPRIFTSAEEQGLVAADASGTNWPAAKLSRGTREALYLAFRLAVIQDFSETRGALPLLLDDILVNFDPERTSATLDVFSRLSGSQQIIAFTCHSAVRDQFAQRQAAVHEVAAPHAQLTQVQSA